MPLREQQREPRTSPLWHFPVCWQLKPFAFLGSRPYHLLSFASPVPSKPLHPRGLLRVCAPDRYIFAAKSRSIRSKPPLDVPLRVLLRAVSTVYPRDFARKNALRLKRGYFAAISRQTSEVVAQSATSSEFNEDRVQKSPPGVCLLGVAHPLIIYYVRKIIKRFSQNFLRFFAQSHGFCFSLL